MLKREYLNLKLLHLLFNKKGGGETDNMIRISDMLHWSIHYFKEGQK